MNYLEIYERTRPSAEILFCGGAYPELISEILNYSRSINYWSDVMFIRTSENTTVCKVYYDNTDKEQKQALLDQYQPYIFAKNYNLTNNIYKTPIYDGPADQYTGSL